MPSHTVSIVVLFDKDQSDRLLIRLHAIQHELTQLAAGELVVVGHGAPEVSAAVARRILTAIPSARMLVHARPCPVDEALFAGVEFSRSPSVILLGAGVDPERERVELAALLSRQTSMVLPFTSASPIRIERNRFLAFPRIRGLRRFLPELLAMNPASPSATPASLPPMQRLRRCWVGLLCRIAGAPTIPPPRAIP